MTSPKLRSRLLKLITGGEYSTYF